MESSIRINALEYLQALVDQPLIYALKSPDTELFDFGFGEQIEVVNQQGKRKRVGTFALHAICRFKIIWRKGTLGVDEYNEETSSDSFISKIQPLIGLKANRVALSEKNDLWIDFVDCWIVFATYKNNEESWRYFLPYNDKPHLVASNMWLRMD